MNRILRLVILSPTMIALVMSTILLLIINRFGNQPLPLDLIQRAKYLAAANMQLEAEPVFEEALREEVNNLDIHYAYIRNHFSIPAKAGAKKDEQTLIDYYKGLINHKETIDVGYFGLGLIEVFKQNYISALELFQLIPNHDLRNVNYSIGRTYLVLGDKKKAEEYFWKEINVNGNLQEAVSQLAGLYAEQKDKQKLQSLLDNPITSAYIMLNQKRVQAYHNREWLEYIRLVYIDPYRNMTLPGGLSALTICIVWIIYLCRLNVFNSPHMIKYAIVVILGIFFTMSSLILSDLFSFYLPISIPINWLNSLVSSIIYIGVVEEVVKLIPVLLIVAISRRVDEPFELMVYGTLSALGFATLENAMYFSLDGLGVALSRYLYSTMVHIGMTAIICYFWAKSRFMKPGNQFWAVLAGLALAAMVHGLFDFFLMGSVSRLVALSFVITFILAREYHRMVSNTLNFSPNFRDLKGEVARLNNFGLFLSTSIIFLPIVFLYYNFDFSTEIAQRQLTTMALSALPASIAVIGALGKIKLSQGKLNPVNNLRFFHSKRVDSAMIQSAG